MTASNSVPAPDTPLPYVEISDDTYSESAAKNFTVTEAAPGTLVLRGPCPRCAAIIETPVVSSIFRSSRSLADWLPRRAPEIAGSDWVEPMMCTCEDEHPGRPQGRTGCGAHWTLTISTAAQ